jgi:hypothetical protein
VSKWWDGEPRRGDRHARDPEPAYRHRSKKNTRLWCRGKPGVEHQTGVRLDSYHEEIDNPCYRLQRWPKNWWCSHQRYCTVCGKIMQVGIGRDCPDFTEAVTRFSRRRSW